MRSYFIWNGQDSRNYGIYLQHAPEIIRAQERVTQLTVHGRAGDLIVTSGDAVYDSYPLTITATIRGADNVRRVWQWLRGDGTLTLPNAPGLEQDARVINSITLQKVSRNLDAWQGEITFWCQPLKRPINERYETVTSGSYLVNDGHIQARPKILLTGTGDLSVTIGDATLVVSTVTAAQGGVLIDCEAEELIVKDGTALITAQGEGTFPVLPVGRSQITFSGATSCEIMKGVRYL